MLYTVVLVVVGESWIGMPDVPGPLFRLGLFHVGVQPLSQSGFGLVGSYGLVPGRSQIIDGDWSGVTPLCHLGDGEAVELGRVVGKAGTFKDGLRALKEWHVCGVQALGPLDGEDWCGDLYVNHTHPCRVEPVVFDRSSRYPRSPRYPETLLTQRGFDMGGTRVV
jgi:hypothetical protein